MYIYLAKEDDFSNVPAEIYNSLGIVEFAMELDLDPNRKLAKEDPVKVLENLEQNGFHIQLPDETPIEEIMTRLARRK